MMQTMNFALVLALAASLAACGARQDTRSEVQQPEGAMADAEIAAVLDAANRAEIEHAQLARDRAETNEVRGYATAMLTGHRAAVEQQDLILQERGISTRESPLSQQIERQAREVRQQLGDLEGEDFDRAYMQTQLQQHQQLLTMLEEQLIPAAQDPQYRMYLEQRRSNLMEHLRNAERIQQQTPS